MDTVVGVRFCPSSGPSGSVRSWKKWTGYRHFRVSMPSLATLEDTSSDSGAAKESFSGRDRRTITSTDNVIKLFNVTQQNMLHLNQQRLIAIDELQKAKRDNEFLLARVAQLEAECQVSVGDCEMLQKRLKAIAGRSASGSKAWELKSGNKGREYLDCFPVWSELLLRIDSMAMTGAVTLGQASALRNLVRKRDAQAADVYVNLREKDDWELCPQLLALLASNRRRGIHIVHICTEMAPIAQTGTLATYITNLCQSLRRKGHMVEVILPKYRSMDLHIIENVKELEADLFSYFNGDWHKNKIWTGCLDGIAVTMVDSKHPLTYFEKDLSDHEDNFERFTYFSRAALEYILKSGKQPNVIHIHNWETAAVAPLFWEIYASQGLQNTRILFTCHDFKYQCLQEPSKLSLCGLDPQKLNRPDRLQDDCQSTLINILKGGIVYSNKVTTVSPLYVHDVLTEEHGHGLDLTLTQHKQKIIGILNGVDELTWNPSSDPLLPAKYSVEDLSGKTVCKSALWRTLNLPDFEKPKPLVGCIAPDLTEQDVEPLRTALGTVLSKGAQFVFIGASKVPQVQLVLEDLQRENQNGHFAVGYDDTLAHQVVAASDILVCPCIFDTSGEWPLIAMTYGTVPVARGIFGDQGSITDADDILSSNLEATGFTFCSMRSSDLASALSRALDQWEGDAEVWGRLIRRGMSGNHSWDGQCVELYQNAYFSICSS